MANSNKHVNEPLRHKYLNENPECELCPVLRRGGAVVVHFGQEGPNGRIAKVGPRNNVATEVDHIFGGTLRHDLWSNFMAVCRSCHEWKHEVLSIGRVVELYVKWRKFEWNVEELNVACRQSVEAWIERQDFLGPDYESRQYDPKFMRWVEGLRGEILQVKGDGK